LANEFKNIIKRKDQYCWLSKKDIHDDVELAILTLTSKQQSVIDQDTIGILKDGNSALHKYCQERGINIRKLSPTDARLLASALELNAAMATDEWPLRLVADLYDYDNGKPVDVLSSIDILFFLEKEKLLTPDERKRIYADWLKFGEKLLNQSPNIYRELFGEEPPDGQY